MGRNTERLGEYVGNHLFYGALFYFVYRRLIFFRLGGFGFAFSRTFLLGLLAVGCLLGILLHVRRGRNGVSVFANVALPFGLYSALAYREYFGALFQAAALAAAVLSVLWAAYVLGRKKTGKRPEAVLPKKRVHGFRRNRLRLAISGAQLLFALALSGAALWVGAGRLLGNGILEPSLEAVSGPEGEIYTISGQMDTLLNLQEKNWSQLSVRERLDVLQTVANIECRYLGIPHGLPVSAANLEEGTLGSYNRESKEILLNLDNLSHGPASEMLETVCHEAYHGYQHCLVAVLEKVSQEEAQLRLFRPARIYQEEFQHYEDGSQSFLDYYFQDCETDARQYAQDAVIDYVQRLEEYVGQE